MSVLRAFGLSRQADEQSAQSRLHTSQRAMASMAWMFQTLDTAMLNMEHMNDSIHRMEVYMLLLVVLMYGLVVIGLVVALTWYYVARWPPISIRFPIMAGCQVDGCECGAHRTNAAAQRDAEKQLRPSHSRLTRESISSKHNHTLREPAPVSANSRPSAHQRADSVRSHHRRHQHNSSADSPPSSFGTGVVDRKQDAKGASDPPLVRDRIDQMKTLPEEAV